jgi:hypothetical protein
MCHKIGSHRILINSTKKVIIDAGLSEKSKNICLCINMQDLCRCQHFLD